MSDEQLERRSDSSRISGLVGRVDKAVEVLEKTADNHREDIIKLWEETKEIDDLAKETGHRVDTLFYIWYAIVVGIGCLVTWGVTVWAI